LARRRRLAQENCRVVVNINVRTAAGFEVPSFTQIQQQFETAIAETLAIPLPTQYNSILDQLTDVVNRQIEEVFGINNFMVEALNARNNLSFTDMPQPLESDAAFRLRILAILTTNLERDRILTATCNELDDIGQLCGLLRGGRQYAEIPVTYGPRWGTIPGCLSGARNSDLQQAAAERSTVLLKEWLSPTQLAQFGYNGTFDVIGGSTGKRYRICTPAPYNIQELDGEGQVVARICIIPRSVSAVGDVMLAQKIALERNEAETLLIANRRSEIPGHLFLDTGVLTIGEIREHIMGIDGVLRWGAVINDGPTS
jgi:hypothetical protein